MEKIPQKKKNVMFASHLQEEDNLEKWRQDGPVVDTEKNRESLAQVSNKIVERVRENHKKAIMFISSPKTRARETAELVAVEIKKYLGEIKVRYSVEDNLRPVEQGDFILPVGYTAGSFFEGLNLASKIFTRESLEGPNKNLNYKFGDPVLQEDGYYKYPELASYFKASGETYAEALIRIFSSVIQFSKKIHKIDSSTEVVLISHGFNFHILRGLSVLAELVKEGKIELETGSVAEKIWEIYKNNTIDFKDMVYVPIDITNLGDEELMAFLSRELEYLKKINKSK